MASKQSWLVEELDKMGQKITCPLCLDHYSDPRCLPSCSHTFCFTCLLSLVIHKLPLVCPQCSTPMPVARGKDMMKMPPSFCINRFRVLFFFYLKRELVIQSVPQRMEQMLRKVYDDSSSDDSSAGLGTPVYNIIKDALIDSKFSGHEFVQPSCLNRYTLACVLNLQQPVDVAVTSFGQSLLLRRGEVWCFWRKR